jgi:menaquinol-cytochrome c reductase iron-sulfur subunit
MGHDQPGRRSFLAWAVTGLGALFTAILGAPVVAYLIDPRNRQGAGGDFRVVDTVPLNELRKDQPVQGVLRSVRRDAWTLHPNDVIGRVWIVLQQESIPASFTGTDPALCDVFTTICPHLGCSVNLSAAGFACPCHGAEFNGNGERLNEHNPAQRGMDTLTWRIDPDPADANRKILLVKYENFKSSIATKDVV